MWRTLMAGVVAVLFSAARGAAAVPVVEVEEVVYSFEPADNGAGPMWCSGSTCLVRAGDQVFASGLETLQSAKPLNNCRWSLFRRDEAGWKQIAADPSGRTREPSPLALLGDVRLLLSANPTLDPSAASGPARPEILEFSTQTPEKPWRVTLPAWDGEPRFTEHSYRSLAADGLGKEAILFQNIDYTHAEWSFLDGEGQWSAHGRLKWPWGGEYEKPQPIRVCYPNVALRNRSVHFCGVSDIVEPKKAWREFKRELTGREWDYDFRRLFYTWTPDITREGFREWVEIASREATCGWVSPGDLWGAPDGTVQVIWTERAIDERLRAKFFPEAKQRHQLNWARLRDGRVVARRTLIEGGEGVVSQEVPGLARFHVAPDGQLRVVCYVGGTGADGKGMSENRLLTLGAGGEIVSSVRLTLSKPFTSFFTATPRAGSAPADVLDLLGTRGGEGRSIGYARIALR